MFTKQHYKAIAEIIKGNKPAHTENSFCMGRKTALEFIADDLAAYFASDNPLFDREKFLAACRNE